MLLIRPHTKDVGFPVKRLLPAAQQQSVGPFLFFDHMGPALFEPDTTAGDVRPHPHIGLSTVTYLYSGAMLHRDSLGVVQRIEPGAINLMTAGHGIVHSERIPEDIRRQQTVVEGIQTWMALPQALEETDPAFIHHDANTLPELTGPGWRIRVLLGSLWDHVSPVRTLSPTLYLDIQLEADARLALPPLIAAEERALYLAHGEGLKVGNTPVPRHHVITLTEGDALIESGDQPARLMVFGGQALEAQRFMVWNFVSTRRDRIEQAREAWQARQFPDVPGETEWIPFP